MNTIEKRRAFVTGDSFGSDLPDNWEEIARRCNDRIELLEEDENGEIDLDAVARIWEEETRKEWDK